MGIEKSIRKIIVKVNNLPIRLLQRAMEKRKWVLMEWLQSFSFNCRLYATKRVYFALYNKEKIVRLIVGKISGISPSW